MTASTWAAVAAINGFLSVAAGAFGAHGLRGKLTPRHFEVFETAARYQMYHALALLAVAWLASRGQSPLISASGWCFVGGIVLFSGSLYTLACTGIDKLGAITPIGGVALLAGWALFAIAAFRANA